MTHDVNSLARAMAAGAILGAFVLGTFSPAAAQTTPGSPASSAPTAGNSATGTTVAPATPKASRGKQPGDARMSPSDRVEARIRDLHSGLGITAAQEPLWGAVAQAMRDNAKAMETVIGERTRKIGTMNAIDDLRSYESLAEVHADGMKKLVDAFAPLYDSLSDAQKKSADALFRRHERHMPASKKS